MTLMDLSISFPNLGINLYNIPKTFSIFGFDIAFYGLIIGLGMLAGMAIGFREAKITGQNVDDYVDLALFGITFAIVGARLYYVIFQWDSYKDDLLQIVNLRKGGLAIYGGVIAAIITCFVLARVKKLKFSRMADTGCLGLLLGQIIGRWGNFFNREAYGGNTNGLFAMKINIDDSTINSVPIQDGIEIFTEAGTRFIQVQPTFLYESFCNLCLLGLIMLFRKKKRYDGEVFLWYMCGYGVIRTVIESFRTDQLQIGNTGIAVSQLLGAAIAIVAGAIIVYMRIKTKGQPAVWKVSSGEKQDEADDIVKEVNTDEINSAVEDKTVIEGDNTTEEEIKLEDDDIIEEKAEV